MHGSAFAEIAAVLAVAVAVESLKRTADERFDGTEAPTEG